MERIGIYGGTYSPPHIGHLKAAEYAIEALGLDRLLLIPTGVSPHKAMSAGATSADRLEMLRLSAAGMEKAMTRIPQRMATELEVTCPECDKAVTVQVVTDEAKKKILVSDKKCKCGYILEAGKSASDFK